MCVPFKFNSKLCSFRGINGRLMCDPRIDAILSEVNWGASTGSATCSIYFRHHTFVRDFEVNQKAVAACSTRPQVFESRPLHLCVAERVKAESMAIVNFGNILVQSSHTRRFSCSDQTFTAGCLTTVVL